MGYMKKVSNQISFIRYEKMWLFFSHKI